MLSVWRIYGGIGKVQVDGKAFTSRMVLGDVLRCTDLGTKFCQPETVIGLRRAVNTLRLLDFLEV